jgi:hypothetical protein
METKNSAIEWLVEQMTQGDFIALPKPEWIKQAKEMEQLQKETEYRRGFQDGKQYYKEEYGNKK